MKEHEVPEAYRPKTARAVVAERGQGVDVPSIRIESFEKVARKSTSRSTMMRQKLRHK
jgi:hypothetical protein